LQSAGGFAFTGQIKQQGKRKNVLPLTYTGWMNLRTKYRKLLIMKYILIFILAILLYSCSSGFIVQDARVTIKGDKIKVVPVGKAERLPDTVMVIKLIRKK